MRVSSDCVERTVTESVPRWETSGGGDPAAQHGADAARGESEDHPGQHVQQVNLAYDRDVIYLYIPVQSI